MEKNVLFVIYSAKVRKSQRYFILSFVRLISMFDIFFWVNMSCFIFVSSVSAVLLNMSVKTTVLWMWCKSKNVVYHFKSRSFLTQSLIGVNEDGKITNLPANFFFSFLSMVRCFYCVPLARPVRSNAGPGPRTGDWWTPSLKFTSFGKLSNLVY